MTRKTKKIIKNTLLGVLCLGIVGGAAAGGKALYDYSKEDLKTINPVFHVGGLDENGEYVDTDQSLYSDSFECRGLEISLDFDNDIKFQVFYYESDGDFVESTEVLEDDYESEITNYGISHARVVITPQWTNVEIPEDKTEEEVKVVKWYNLLEYSSQLEIKVSKNQECDMVDITDEVTENLHKKVSVDGFVDQTGTSYWKLTSDFIDSYEYVEIHIPNIESYVTETNSPFWMVYNSSYMNYYSYLVSQGAVNGDVITLTPELIDYLDTNSHYGSNSGIYICARSQSVKFYTKK